MEILTDINICAIFFFLIFFFYYYYCSSNCFSLRSLIIDKDIHIFYIYIFILYIFFISFTWFFNKIHIKEKFIVQLN